MFKFNTQKRSSK